jgi:hypothetical protein
MEEITETLPLEFDGILLDKAPCPVSAAVVAGGMQFSSIGNK